MVEKIKIPSKNIYGKTNQKVITNLIDNIEVQQKLPQIISDTENIYNSSISVTPSPYTPQKGIPSTRTENFGMGISATTYWNIAYIEEIPTYVTQTFTIPVELYNSAVIRILTGKNKNEEANIKYSLRGTTKEGTATGYVHINVFNQAGVVADIPIVQDPIKVVTTNDTSYTITTNDTDTSYTSKYTGVTNLDTTATFTLLNLSDIAEASAKPTNDGKNYTITITFLAGLRIDKLGGGTNNTANNDPTNTNLYLTGEYAEYIPTTINVSFYGDTIKLDLQDNALIISNGKNSYSFSGNELMQSTNTPSIANTYKQVIAQYENGKEVATLKCNLDNYYTMPTNVTIMITGSYIVGSIRRVTMTSSEKLKVGQEIQLSNGGIIKIVTVGEQYIYGETSVSTSVPDFNTNIEVILLPFPVISPTNQERMTIDIGNIVIPYIYTAQGVDKPMSYYIDNTPKEFVVIGKGVSYKGRIYQNLTLQEIPKNIIVGGG